MVVDTVERLGARSITVEPQEKVGVRVGSLGEQGDIFEAAQIVESGGIVAAQVYGVFGIWGDGSNPRIFDDMEKIKGDTDQTKPYSAMMFSADVANYVDRPRLHPSLSALFDEPNRLSDAVGTMLHLRLPLKPDAVDHVPGRMRSYQDGAWVIHNLDPSGHPIARFINELNRRGILFPAVTTLNEHLQPENTTLEGAQQTLAKADSSAQKVALVLTDPTYRAYSHAEHQVQGSLVVVDTINAKIVRHGFVPAELASLLLQAQLNVQGATEGHYPVDSELDMLIERAHVHSYSPQQIRLLIHNFIEGSVRFR